ncbi:MAG: class II fructose-bisphosphate aldolase [Patescibacteria group bacterium]
MIVSVKKILEEAKKGHYAVGAFNTVNLETTAAIIEAAAELRSPVIVQMTEKTLDYAGGEAIFALMNEIAKSTGKDIPIGFHLDHGKTLEVVEKAIGLGLTSVMYDGSRKLYSENLEITKMIVKLANEKGVCVQGELGNVPYLGEMQMETVKWEEYMTDPKQAKEFVEETGVVSLAVAIGNAHGFFRERSEPDFERLSAISQVVSVPLVLHGASDWDDGRVQEVIDRGISCFNVDTAIRLAFLSGLRDALLSEEETDLRKVLGQAKDYTKKRVKEKIIAFRSNEKANYS